MADGAGGLRSRLAGLHRGGSSPVPRAGPGLVEQLRRAGRGGAAQGQPDEAGEARLATYLGGETLSAGLILVKDRVERIAPRDSFPYSVLWNTQNDPGLPLWAVDTETTGLAGGTGTTAFLIGLAWVSGDAIEVRQWLLTRFGAEQQMLREVSASIEQDLTLLSYNGKSFDLPLLATRYRLHRLSDPFRDRAHLDLLHLVRRAFGSKWPDCRLAGAEQRLLGRPRENDLPGSAAPDAWRDWLRRGSMHELSGVMRHNRQDLLSLFDLGDALAEVYAGQRGIEVDPVGLAGFHAKAGRLRLAIEVLEYRRSVLGQKGRQVLGDLYKRAKRWDDARALWQLEADNGNLQARIELAKYYEHVARDPYLALQTAHQASVAGVTDEALEHRLARLHSRCEHRPWNGSLF